jgi:hypothetical protein
LSDYFVEMLRFKAFCHNVKTNAAGAVCAVSILRIALKPCMVCLTLYYTIMSICVLDSFMGGASLQINGSTHQPAIIAILTKLKVAINVKNMAIVTLTNLY